jgi:inorganic pyrophosphatase
LGGFVVGFGALLLVLLIAFTHNVPHAILTCVAFVAGSLASILSGFLGMKIAVFANSRTALSALGVDGWTNSFNAAFKAGTVMGFSLVAIGMLVLYILFVTFNLYYTNAFLHQNETIEMFEAIAGFGLGGSSIALFGRVGGGIYTKAADVGADLVGKIEQGMPEDDPRNPAVIADNVGDNVGDIAGMGADLFGSFAESSCALMVVAARSPDLYVYRSALMFPLVIQASGVLVCFLTSFVATHIMPVQGEKDVEATLKRQLLVSTVLETPAAFACSIFFLPASFTIDGLTVKNYYAFFCIACGLWSGLIIGYITEYYTSNANSPVQLVAKSSQTGGAATVIIYGLALGYKSVVIPVVCMSITIFVSYTLAGMFGIACAALGILSTMSIGLTIDAYGPICDNGGGIAEMCEMDESVRAKTDVLDAAGNTTAAIGKGFAIGSAAFVSLALYGAFVSTIDGLEAGVNILRPFTFAGLLMGAMIPYWFTAMTMQSVGKAAEAMVEEVRRQFREHPGIISGDEEPKYEECVAISTDASLKEMVAPGALVMLTPIVTGFLFGPEALAGVLAGSLVSSVQLALSASNTGGAWDNAKKYVEQGHLGEGNGKGSACHAATVVGDTVGDPLKDTSGPSLNIVMKLSAIISLVFAPAMPSVAAGGLLVQLFSKV